MAAGAVAVLVYVTSVTTTVVEPLVRPDQIDELLWPVT